MLLPIPVPRLKARLATQHRGRQPTAMSDSYARLERLRRKRDAETDPEERAAVDEAIAALEEKIRAADATAQPSGRIATVPGHVGFLNLGDIKGNVFINGRRGKEPSKLVEGYLRRLAGHCALLPLQGVREQRAATDTFNLSLNEVYTQLATQSVADRERFQGERLHQLDIVALRDRQREEDLLPVATLTQLRAILPADKAFGGQVKALLEERSQIDVGDAQALAGVHAWTTFDNNRLSEYQANATTLIFSGPQIVTEAIAATQHLALLGEPIVAAAVLQAIAAVVPELVGTGRLARLVSERAGKGEQRQEEREQPAALAERVPALQL